MMKVFSFLIKASKLKYIYIKHDFHILIRVEFTNLQKVSSCCYGSLQEKLKALSIFYTFLL